MFKHLTDWQSGRFNAKKRYENKKRKERYN